MSSAGENAAIPRPAATVVILRDGHEGIEAFMVVRHHEIDFASGALVFPGGKVDPHDADPAWDPVVKDPTNIDEMVEKKTRALRASYETQDSLAVGVFYAVDLPTYDEQLAVKVPALKEHPLVDLPLYQRDVDPLFAELA